MHLSIGLLACFGATTLSVACTHPSAASSATSTRAAAASESPNGPRMESLLQHFEQEGYEPVMRNGQIVYCRNQMILGSQTPVRKTCATASELRLEEQPKGRRTDVFK